MKKLLIAASIVLLTMFTAAPSFAKTITFQWEYNTNEESVITAFRLYQAGTAGGYGTEPMATALPDKRTLSVTTADKDGDYFFVLTAYDAKYGNESPRSNEVSFSVVGGKVIFPTPPESPKIMTIRVTD